MKPKYARFVAYERGKIDIHSSEEQEPAWQAFVEGMELLEKKFGTLDVPWGKINVVVRNGVFPMDGTSVELFGVLHPDEGPEQDDGRIFCNDGWGHLMIVVEPDRKHTQAQADLEPVAVRGIGAHGFAALQRLGEAAQPAWGKAVLVQRGRDIGPYRVSARR